MEALQILNRNEMKMIKGGNLCDRTNCLICETGNECKSFDGSNPGPKCSWGICFECCPGDT
jgi:hypothetical protein